MVLPVVVKLLQPAIHILSFFEVLKAMNTLPIRAEPYAHQKEAFTATVESFRSGKSYGYSLLMEMGTGKSLSAMPYPADSTSTTI
jgi:superfamily II DNA or RNA helicase